MPGEIAIPLALAGASMIGTNVQNKAAIKNNEVQQASAVGNAKEAWQSAKTASDEWQAKNPSPVAGATVGRPQAGPYGAGGLISPTIAGKPGAGGGDASALVAMIMAALKKAQASRSDAQPAAKPAAPTPQGPAPSDPAQQLAQSQANSPGARPDGLTLTDKGLEHDYAPGKDAQGRTTTIGTDGKLWVQYGNIFVHADDPRVAGAAPAAAAQAPALKSPTTPGTGPALRGPIAGNDGGSDIVNRILGRAQRMQAYA